MSKKINIAVFIGIIFSLVIIFIIKDDELLSYSERRYLTQANDITIEDVKNGQIVTKLENYALDQFPFRDCFREAKAFTNYNIFLKEENHGIIISGDTMYELKNSYNYDNLSSTIAKINSIANSMFYENNCYFSIIPDKSIFLELNNEDYNYEAIEQIALASLHPRISHIPICDTLSADSFYKTDLHWSQDKITETKNVLLEHMAGTVDDDFLFMEEREYYGSESVMNSTLNDATIDEEALLLTSEDYTTNYISDYIGSYGVKSASPYINDEIVYLTSSRIDSSTVYNYETGKTTPIYVLDKLSDSKSLDKYDIFLSGASPLLKVTAPDKTGKTLLMFRDSFGSSLAPLLLEYYDTIYLVDLRYIDSSLIRNFIEIKPEYDVLFLYNSSMLEITGNF